MGEPRNTTVDDLSRYDLGHVVRFPRLHSGRSDRLVVKGTLLSITPATYYRGNMPRPGVTLRIRYRRRPDTPEWMESVEEDHGPLPMSHPVEVLRARSTGPTMDESLTRLRAHIERTQDH